MTENSNSPFANQTNDNSPFNQSLAIPTQETPSSELAKEEPHKEIEQEVEQKHRTHGNINTTAIPSAEPNSMLTNEVPEVKAINATTKDASKPEASKKKEQEMTASPENQNASNIRVRLDKILIDKLGVEQDEIHDQASIMNELGADSLDIVELGMEVEREFNILIPDEELEKIHTVAELEQAIEIKTKVGVNALNENLGL